MTIRRHSCYPWRVIVSGMPSRAEIERIVVELWDAGYTDEPVSVEVEGFPAYRLREITAPRLEEMIRQVQDRSPALRLGGIPIVQDDDLPASEQMMQIGKLPDDLGEIQTRAVPLTRDEVFQRFLIAAAKVWGDVVTRLNIDMGEDQPRDFGKKVYAALVCDKTQLAVRHILWHHAPHYKLLVSDELLSMDDDSVQKILIHEACHIGHSGHTEAFRQLVREKGGAVSGSAVDEGNVVKAQRKEGSRYVTIKTFTDEKEAYRWTTEEKRRVPGKYRLSM